MKTYIDEYIEYPEETTNPFSTIKKALKNIPKMFPDVKAVLKRPRGQSAGIELSSENEDQLKKAFIMLYYSNGEEYYSKLIANGTLEDALESTDFYAYSSKQS